MRKSRRKLFSCPSSVFHDEVLFFKMWHYIWGVGEGPQVFPASLSLPSARPASGPQLGSTDGFAGLGCLNSQPLSHLRVGLQSYRKRITNPQGSSTPQRRAGRPLLEVGAQEPPPHVSIWDPHGSLQDTVSGHPPLILHPARFRKKVQRLS